MSHKNDIIERKDRRKTYLSQFQYTTSLTSKVDYIVLGDGASLNRRSEAERLGANAIAEICHYGEWGCQQ